MIGRIKLGDYNSVCERSALAFVFPLVFRWCAVGDDDDKAASLEP